MADVSRKKKRPTPADPDSHLIRVVSLCQSDRCDQRPARSRFVDADK